jgi:2-oxoisovalerate dehydrogenase E1 component
MKFDTSGLSNEFLKETYKQILFPRMVEEKMLKLLRQGKIGKWFSGIGQEAIAVGSTLAMQKEEYILPMHRNLGVFTSREVPLNRLMSQFLGKKDGFTKGRDRSFHFGTQDYHIVGMISHLGPQMALADGIALANVLNKEQKVCLVYTGDGASSEGDFHEAINVAAVWDLPVIFLIENNGYGLSTPNNEQFKCEFLASRAKGYGIEGYTIDGNNILEVYSTIDKLATEIRKKPRPVIVECLTFRMRGHEEASGVAYVPEELIQTWAEKDPVQNYQDFLLKKKIIKEEEIEQFRATFKKQIEQELQIAFDSEDIEVSEQNEIRDVYAPNFVPIIPPTGDSRELRYIDAISEGLVQAMQKFPNLVLMGQDIAEYGGAFKITKGFVDKFGKARVRNTPLCESAIVGTGLGLSINGYKSVVEMQFADFVSCGFNQIVNNLAKSYYRWGQHADVVLRMPTGAGTGAGPFHSQSNEAWFTKTPGLKIVYPSNPYDAKGLLLTSIEDPNPVMYFEHKFLYRTIQGDVPEGYYTIELGKGKRVQEGEQLSIITYGWGVHWALEIAKAYPNHSIDIIDLRTLIPWDKEMVLESVQRCGRVIVLHEDTLTTGFGAEISSWIAEHAFQYLDAPIMRCASLDTAIPMNKQLDDQFLAKSRLKACIDKLLAY